jgi:TIR domain
MRRVIDLPSWRTRIQREEAESLLDKKTRIKLIFAVADKLAEPGLSWAQVNVVLATYGLEAYSQSSPTTLSELISAASDDVLVELAEFVDIPVPVSSTPPAAVSTTVRSAQPLFVFASHLSAERHFIGVIREELARFGITLFVAHDSIPDDATWHQEIEKGLDAADAGLVFLHPGFKESDWCPQELGWLLGRHVPVIPLNFGITPFGPLGKLQAGPERSTVAQVISENILDRLVRQETLRGGLVASLVKAMQASGSFNRTDRIWKYLRELECDASQSAELLVAAKTNDQVYRAGSALDGTSYPRAIVDYLRRQPEADVVKADIDAYEEFLDDQDFQEEVARRERAGEPPF